MKYIKLYEGKSFTDDKLSDAEKSEIYRRKVKMTEEEYKVVYNLTKKYIKDLIYYYDSTYQTSTTVNHYNNNYYELDISKLEDDYYIIEFYVRFNYVKPKDIDTISSIY